MATEGFIQGTSGEEISLLVDGVKIMALQNLSWKASQSKSPIRGAGYRKPHAMGRAFKEYELDFEVKELNKAIIEEAINSRRSREVQIKTFKIGDQEFSDLLDLRNCTILIVYPRRTTRPASSASWVSSLPTWRAASPSTTSRWDASSPASPSTPRGWFKEAPMSTEDIKLLAEKIEALTGRVGELERTMKLVRNVAYVLIGVMLGSGALQVKQVLALLGG